ncbi:MAG: PQQ-binding-like beta-propeller repeat protein [Pirellulaceae bacterium]
MFRRPPCVLLLSILLFHAAWATSHAQEWTRFRGPNGSGVGRMKRPPITWSEDDYKWKVTLPGVGHSSPVLWGGKLFVTSGDEQSGARYVLGLDAESGRELWRREFPAAHHGKHKLNSFASPTPTVDAARVYVAWGAPEQLIVLALDHQGEEQWRVDLGPFKSGHGFGVSLILHDGLLIVPNEQQGDSSLVALEADSGKLRWRVPRDSKVAYSTPCLLPREGGHDLIFTTWEYGVSGHDPQTGAMRWQADLFDKSHVETSIGSPITAGGLVLGLSGWLGHGEQLIAVRVDEENGEPKPREVYRIERGAPLCTTPLVVGDLLFLWADEGVVTCADAQTGEVHWRRRVGGTYYSSPIAVGGCVYNLSVDGEVVVLAASTEFKELARNDLGESSHATPAVADGVMYLRTFTQLFALE